jgi:single-strand DNA-binding protein
MNRVQIVGRLGRDPDVRYSQKGTAVCRLAIATEDGWGDQKETSWHNVVVFGKQAEACDKHLAKGMRAAVNGRLKYQETPAKNPGEKPSRWTEIVADSVEFLFDKKQERKAAAGAGEEGQGESGSLDF